ncbi:MAG: acyl-CoA synthetase (AMP-forming)/AMP-acid ligase II [Kiritimatiellia bacterium]|jgi:acyl-CoA synthetase (AMP-forming)/AMP-acid ligase II
MEAILGSKIIDSMRTDSEDSEPSLLHKEGVQVLPRDFVRRTGLNNPTRTAYICGDRQATWGQMHARSDLIAAVLLSKGLRVGDSVALLAPECIEVYEHFFACMKVGAIRVGVNRRFAHAEILHVLKDSGAKFFFVHAACGDLSARLREDLKQLDITLIGFAGDHDFEEDMEALMNAVESVPDMPPLSSADPLFYSYTSGTTGVPKGAVLTNGGTTITILHALAEFGFVRDDRFFLPTGNAWVAVVLAFLGLGNGMTHVIADGDYNRATFFDIVKEQAITTFLLAPTMLKWALEDNKKTPFDLSSVRMIIYGSSPASPHLIQCVHEAFGKDMTNVYALTETTWGGVTFLSPDDHRRGLSEKPELLFSVGRVASHFEISVRDEEGQSVDEGGAGEIWLRGPTLMTSYLNLPEQTQEVLKDGWLRTNDIGRVDEDGYLYLLDRKNFMIISGGVNVYPASVEAVLGKHPGLAAVCVIGLPHPEWGEAVVAVVRPSKSDQKICADDLIEFCRDKLNRASTPKHIFFTDEEFPLTANFKVRKNEVRDFLLTMPKSIPWDCEGGWRFQTPVQDNSFGKAANGSVGSG